MYIAGDFSNPTQGVDGDLTSIFSELDGFVNQSTDGLELMNKIKDAHSSQLSALGSAKEILARFLEKDANEDTQKLKNLPNYNPDDLRQLNAYISTAKLPPLSDNSSVSELKKSMENIDTKINALDAKDEKIKINQMQYSGNILTILNTESSAENTIKQTIGKISDGIR